MRAFQLRLMPSLAAPTLRALALAIAFVTAVPSPAVAIDLDDAPSILNAATLNPAVPKRLNLGVGKSIMVDLPRDAKEVFVANPGVANAVVRSTRKVFLIAIADGTTSVFIMDAQGAQIANLEIMVGHDMNKLRRTLKVAMPNSNIIVTAVDNTIVLTGEVASALEAQRAADIANGFIGSVNGEGKGTVVNSITVKAKDQVMVKVTIAEVKRDIIKQLGIDVTGSNWRVLNSPTNFLLDFPVTSGTAQAVSQTNINIQGSAGRATTLGSIKALERDGVARVLAEPTLTAISGEASKFTAGGTYPVPSSVPSCTNQNGFNQCSIGVDFKPYGVTLGFTPVVLSTGRISMRITTEVTDIDFENTFQVSLSNFSLNIPGTKTRQAESTVELPSGGSIAIAGLIQQEVTAHLNGLPGLMKLPILGALFRSRDYQRNETELVIFATPYIVKPVAPSEIARPDDNFIDPTDAQTVLLGKLNKIYGVAGANGLPPDYRGKVGFIHD